MGQVTRRRRKYRDASPKRQRHYAKVDRYYVKCQKVANGHHAELPHVKRYMWLVNQDYR